MMIIFIASSALIAYHFLLHPILLILLSAWIGRPAWHPASENASLPSVTVLVPCCNEGRTIAAKADNLLAQDYPAHRLEIVFAADGNRTDLRFWLGDRLRDPRIRAVTFPEPRGKIPVLNDAVGVCRNEILVMTDVGAQFSDGTLRALTEPFRDRTIGGVCGVHRVQCSTDADDMGNAQRIYWQIDGWVKKAESRLGSITSSDGPIYAIRRKLYSVIPSGVTDDSYQAMAIVRRGWRFVYSDTAVAHIQPRSKSFSHEIRRRRRVVVRSVRGLWLSRALLNIRRYRLYALSLLSQKVLRRCLPLLFALVLLSSAFLGLRDERWGILFLIQLGGYGLGLSLPLAGIPRRPGLRWAGQLQRLCGYFLAGQIGTLLGVLDFLRGRRIERWTPAQSGD